MKKISIVTPTYNEIQNIQEIYEKIKNEFNKLDYSYEHIIIDNFSVDGTIEKIKEIASLDKNVKVIINIKNFGHIRSPFYGLLQSSGDATILMASDFQDPIEMIPKYIKQWEKGSKIVLGEKTTSEENNLIFSLRKTFYNFLHKISQTKLTINTTGSGIFDKEVLNKIKNVEDPYPYFRGLISELGYEVNTIKFKQPIRKSGKTKNNFFTLYDIGMLGVVKHSRFPLRLITMLGFVSSFVSFFIALIYLFYKLLFWNSFEVGVAPLVIGIFGFASVQILLLGVIGEYVGVMLVHLRKLPLVIEKERINFD
tara:strand:- start:849 stop:1778 length:930 start_codon:yes stop_codon:yes gene_type:complete